MRTQGSHYISVRPTDTASDLNIDELIAFGSKSIFEKYKNEI